MKIVAIAGRCTGHARCAAVAPGIFDLDDDGYTAITEKEVAPGEEALARRGVNSCPERALVLLDDDETVDGKA